MIDREKVITGLEHCSNEADCRGCVYWEQMKDRSDGCDCMREALALLKEQEAKPVIVTNAYGTRFYHCPKCNRDLYAYIRQRYCSNCGQGVKWE